MRAPDSERKRECLLWVQRRTRRLQFVISAFFSEADIRQRWWLLAGGNNR
jgi:hypothetical protein